MRWHISQYHNNSIFDIFIFIIYYSWQYQAVITECYGFWDKNLCNLGKSKVISLLFISAGQYMA